MFNLFTRQISVWLGAVLWLSSAAAFAQPVEIAGTTVSLTPPTGFVASDTFSGFVNPQTKASVVVVELPKQAAAQIGPTFSDLKLANDAFARRNVKLSERLEVDVAGQKVPLLSGEQQIPGRTVVKYFAMFEGAKTVMLTFNALEPTHMPKAEVLKVIQSVVLGAEPSLAEKLSKLQFAATAAAPFEVRDVLGGSAIMMSTQAAADPSGRRPVIIIARAMDRRQLGDPARASEALIRSIQRFDEAKIEESREAPFAGGTGHYARGSAKGMVAIQYLLQPEGAPYLRFLAIGEANSIAEVDTAIQTIAESVTLRAK